MPAIPVWLLYSALFGGGFFLGTSSRLPGRIMLLATVGVGVYAFVKAKG